MDTIIVIVVALIIVGAILYLVNNVLEIDPKYKTFITVIVTVAVVIWLLLEYVRPMLR